MKGIPPPPDTVMVCCSVLRMEVESLCRAHWPSHEPRFLPSMMHLHPERLERAIHSVLLEEQKACRGVVLIYGDCCTGMTDLEARPGVVRTRGLNCCELLLGSEAYHQLSREGAFFLTPGWACLWKAALERGLGLNREIAASLMQELHRKLVYLDTGLTPVPDHALGECAKYCGLPLEVQFVSLERLRLATGEALLRCTVKEPRHELG